MADLCPEPGFEPSTSQSSGAMKPSFDRILSATWHKFAFACLVFGVVIVVKFPDVGANHYTVWKLGTSIKRSQQHKPGNFFVTIFRRCSEALSGEQAMIFPEKTVPLWTMARWKRPRANGESVSRDTLIAPETEKEIQRTPQSIATHQV